MKAMDERYDKGRALPREGMAKRGRDNPRRQIGLWISAVVIPGFLIRLWLQADPDRRSRRPSRRKSCATLEGWGATSAGVNTGSHVPQQRHDGPEVPFLFGDPSLQPLHELEGTLSRVFSLKHLAEPGAGDC